jgi:serine/threonine protein kinase
MILSSEIRWKPGEIFGKTGYIVRDVKMGGMAIVYIISNPDSASEIYAVKTFKDEYIREEEAIKRFWIEAQTWVELERHQNLVYADHIFEIEGKPYIYLEYVDGGSLRDLLNEKKIGPSQILNLVIQFCTGMEAVRTTKGLIHRDIKPENCLITHDSVLKVTDWGLAKIFSKHLGIPPGQKQKKSHFSFLHKKVEPSFDYDLSLTRIGEVLGTPLYMSPEQWQGEKLTISSDIYSFGCMFYEMLAGEFPFRSNNVLELKINHLQNYPKQINSISKDLNKIIRKCMEKESGKRYESFEEVGNDILKVDNLIGTGGKIYDRVSKGWQPLSSDELRMKGFGLLHLRKDKEAIEYFKKAVQKNPNDYVALGYMGYCYGNINEHKMAINVCEKSIQINPNFAHAYGNLGYSYGKLKMFEKSVENYKKAVDLDPDDVTHYNNITIAFEEWGDFERKPEIYSEGLYYADLGLKVDPNYYRLWSNKGNCLLKLRKYAEAIDAFTRSLRINPRSYSALIGLSICLEAIGRYDEAKQFRNLANGIDSNYIT